MFAPATRERLKLRLAVAGPSGSGKTYTALRLARALVGPSGKIAVVDTEHGSARKYVGQTVDGAPVAFDVVEPNNFAPTSLADIIRAAVKAGYDAIIIDSLTHYWSGPGGVLELAGGQFNGWKNARPREQAMWDAMLGAPIHVIATMRTKTVYEVSENAKGKAAPKKVGTDSQQREGAEYEFDIVLRMDQAVCTIDKTRCSALHGLIVSEPGPPLADAIRAWLEPPLSAPRPEPAPTAHAEPPAPPAWDPLQVVARLEGVGLHRGILEPAHAFGAPAEEWPETYRAPLRDLYARCRGRDGAPAAVVESSTAPGTYWLVMREAGDVLACDCPAGRHGKQCLHLAVVEA